MKSLDKMAMGSGVLFVEQNGSACKFIFECSKTNSTLKLFLKTNFCMEIAEIKSNKTEVGFDDFIMDDSFVAIVMNENDYPVLYGSKDPSITYSTASLNDYIKCKIVGETMSLFEENNLDEIIDECICEYEKIDHTTYLNNANSFGEKRSKAELKFIDIITPFLSEIMPLCPHDNILETEIKNSQWVVTPTDENLLIGVIRKENKIAYVSIGYPVLSFDSYCKKLDDSHLFRASSSGECSYGYELLIVEAETGKPHIFTNYA